MKITCLSVPWPDKHEVVVQQGCSCQEELGLFRVSIADLLQRYDIVHSPLNSMVKVATHKWRYRFTVAACSHIIYIIIIIVYNKNYFGIIIGVFST